MNENEVVIEVKCNLNKIGIRKDFITIESMVNNYGYKNGIFILTGYDMNCFREKILPEINNYDSLKHKKNIYIFCKKNSDSSIEVFTLDELKK